MLVPLTVQAGTRERPIGLAIQLDRLDYNLLIELLIFNIFALLMYFLFLKRA